MGGLKIGLPVLAALLSTAVPGSSADRLPDGGVAEFGAGTVRQAWYAMPVSRYDHAILGDAIEAGALEVRLSSGGLASFTLPQDEVFEDITPRLADLDGDGNAEIITVLTSLSKGASIAVFATAGDRLKLTAQTPFIGTTHRWLNIAEIAMLDGKPAIAAVFTPHIGGPLRIYRYDGAELGLIASAQGFSNHRIGSRQLNLSVMADVNGKPAIILPGLGRKTLRVMTYADGNLTEAARAVLPSPAAGNFELRGRKVHVPLENGSVFQFDLP